MTTPTPTMGLIRVAVIALAVIGATALGGWRVAGAMTPSPDRHTLVAGGVHYKVTNVREIKGLSDHDLGGMSHGVQGLVSTGSALVQVDLTVQGGDSTASYNAGFLEVVGTGGKSGARPVAGTLAKGTVSAHGTVEGTLSYVLPRDGSQLRLRIRPGSRSIPLLHIARETAAPTDHSHDDGSPAPDHHDDAPEVGPTAGSGS